MALNRIELLTLLAMLRLGDKAYGVTIYEEIQRIAGADVVDGRGLQRRRSARAARARPAVAIRAAP